MRSIGPRRPSAASSAASGVALRIRARSLRRRALLPAAAVFGGGGSLRPAGRPPLLLLRRGGGGDLDVLDEQRPREAVEADQHLAFADALDGERAAQIDVVGGGGVGREAELDPADGQSERLCLFVSSAVAMVVQ